MELAGTTIARDLELSHGTSFDRQVFLPNAKIGASFTVTDVEASGPLVLFAAAAKIGNELRWQRVNLTDDGIVDLHDVTATRLVDDPTAWGDPSQKNLVLSGLTFTALGEPDDGDDDYAARLAWLRQQRAFDLGPYRAASAVLKSEGQDRQSRKLVVKGEWDRLRRGGVGLAGRIWGYVFGATTAFGNATWRVVPILAAVIAVAGLFFQNNKSDFSTQVTTAVSAGSSKPVDQTVTASTDRCAAEPPCFNGFTFAVHAAIPGLTIGRIGEWSPSDDSLIVGIILQAVFWLLAGSLAAALALFASRRT